MSEAPIPICVVPWNSAKWTDRFLLDVRARTKMPYKILISDNSDKPDLREGDDIEYWWNGGNIGFARAINRALHNAKSDIVVVANEDINLPPEWLTMMVEAYKASEFAILAPLMNARPQEPGKKYPENVGLREAIFAPISALWVTSKSRLLDKYGYWDEQFPGVGCADMYHCWRVWQGGGTVGICTDLYVHHHGGGITAENMSKSDYTDQMNGVKKVLREIYGPEFSDRKPGA